MKIDSWKNNNLFVKLKEDEILEDYVRSELLDALEKGEDLNEDCYVIPYTEYEKHVTPEIMKFRQKAFATKDFAEDNFRGYYNSKFIMKKLKGADGVYLDRVNDTYKVVVNINKVSNFTANTILDFIDEVSSHKNDCVRPTDNCVVNAIKNSLRKNPEYQQLLSEIPSQEKSSTVDQIAHSIIDNNDYLMNGLTAILDPQQIKNYID